MAGQRFGQEGKRNMAASFGHQHAPIVNIQTPKSVVKKICAIVTYHCPLLSPSELRAYSGINISSSHETAAKKTITHRGNSDRGVPCHYYSCSA